MKRMILSVMALFMMFQTKTFAQGTEDMATLAVLPFTIDRSITITIDGRVIKAELLETEFSNQLMAFLVKSGKFKVLDREHIRKIMDENKLTESDYAKPGEDQRIGKLLVADYLVLGSIDRLEFVLKPVNIKITGEKTTDVIATFKFNFRITKVESGQIVFADTIKERLRSRDVRREIPIEERRDWTLSDFKDYLFNKTTTVAGNDILQGIYPVKVAAISGNNITLNRGKGAGIKIGERFEVFSGGQVVIDPDTGKKLGQEETKVGIIEITSVLPKFSKALLIQIDQPIKVGSICRKLKVPKSDGKTPVYPRATPGW